MSLQELVVHTEVKSPWVIGLLEMITVHVVPMKTEQSKVSHITMQITC